MIQWAVCMCVSEHIYNVLLIQTKWIEFRWISSVSMELHTQFQSNDWRNEPNICIELFCCCIFLWQSYHFHFNRHDFVISVTALCGWKIYHSTSSCLSFIVCCCFLLFFFFFSFYFFKQIKQLLFWSRVCLWKCLLEECVDNCAYVFVFKIFNDQF